MRSTCGSVRWHLNENNQLVGLSLGADACAEHEVGSRGIARAFGYDYSAKAGVNARQFTKLPAAFAVREVAVNSEPHLLVTSSLEHAEYHMTNRGELRFFAPTLKGSESNTAAAWDEDNFAILARGEDIALLRELADAFSRLDVMAGGLLKMKYSVRGLVFAIASRVPPEILVATQQELDEEVQRASILENSGIHARLKAAGLDWFSLSQTMWADDTKTAIRVWLNPENQRAYNFGWYTLEALEQWAQGTGPVVRQRASR